MANQAMITDRRRVDVHGVAELAPVWALSTEHLLAYV
jgi:hypothetical protein